MTLTLSFRVIHERNGTMSMEMSFFISFPLRNAVPGPVNRGTLMPPVKGHEIKKTSPFSSYASLLCKRE
jgi:hypothetical protein